MCMSYLGITRAEPLFSRIPVVPHVDVSGILISYLMEVAPMILTMMFRCFQIMTVKIFNWALGAQ